MATADYEVIGENYSVLRQPDLRIAAIINSHLEAMESIVNLGAGTGSYEPEGKIIAAVEPSETMIRQRIEKPNTAVYQAAAENLPFESHSYDAAMAILTIHHWENWAKGLSEAYRVAKEKVVLLTWFGMPQGFWLYDYFKELEDLDTALFPTLEQISSVLGEVEVIPVPIPSDCTDGFLCAYWARPEMYLHAEIRSGISTFSRISNTQAGLDKLASDLKSGEWQNQYGHLLNLKEYDYGYRLVVGRK